MAEKWLTTAVHQVHIHPLQNQTAEVALTGLASLIFSHNGMANNRDIKASAGSRGKSYYSRFTKKWYFSEIKQIN